MSKTYLTELPLYPDEDEIARFILGPRRAREWKAKAILLEREGFPPVDPFMGGRSIEKVKRFFAQREGLDGGPGSDLTNRPKSSRVRLVPPAVDGLEAPDAAKKKATYA